MSAPEFQFGITLAGGALGPDDHVSHAANTLLVDVFRSVLWQVGLSGDAADRLLEQLLAAHRAAPAGDSCTLRFVAHAGQIEIALSQAGRQWRTSCPVPIR
ncbi:MAG TPA: hypothetical protein VLV86_02015 [Vicinamibacterales bacterium]|nr:hypothetical protein [Vicinamibacterales bacterium]